jgi:hypothetical protein
VLYLRNERRIPMARLYKKYALYELEAMPTLSQGHFDDLKVDTGTMRVWLSRCTVEDGEPYNNKVTVEVLKDGKWEIVNTYQAK